jgi:hypothetical protein
MKALPFLLLILFNCSIYAQKPLFVRVYNLDGKKINKGEVFLVTDTSLQLIGKKSPVNIPINTIGSIKTKHSAGNNLLIGSIIGTTTFALIGATSASPEDEILGYTAGEGAAAGALVGLSLGAAIGGLTILLKNSKTFLINGNSEKWKEFETAVAKRNSKTK